MLPSMLFSRFHNLRSLGVTCREFMHPQLIVELISHVPQLQELALGECSATETSALSSRLAQLGALHVLTFAARAPEKNVYGRVMDETTAHVNDFISAATACLNLRQLIFIAFRAPGPTTAATAHMNLCALGHLAHLRSLTVDDCVCLVYVLSAAPVSSHPLDFRVLSSAPVKSHYVVCYRPVDWCGTSCISPSGEIRVRL